MFAIGQPQTGGRHGIELANLDGDGALDIVRSYKIRDSAVFGDAANENILEVWVR